MSEINSNNNLTHNQNNTQIELELLIHRLQIENTTKNIEISRLREELQQYKKNIKFTSINFPLPEEFKTRWETLIKTLMMDAFENISTNPILLMKTINIIVNLLYEISIKKIKLKIYDILKCLGLNEKKEEIIKNFFEKFKKLIFQEYFNNIFKINNKDFIKETIINIKNEIKKEENEKIFSNEEKVEIINDLNSKNFEIFIIELYNLCLYMNINDQKLIIKTSTKINYKYYNKKIYSNIEGFSNENDICLLILNPPITINNINYKGIKPIVCIIDNPSKEIKDLCAKQNNKDIINSFYKTSNYCFKNKKNKKFNSEFILLEKGKNNKIDKNKSKNIKTDNILLDNKIKNEKITKDDFNYKYKINLENIQNKILEKDCKSYKSAFLNINHNKFRKIYKELKLSKNNSLSMLNKIKFIKKNPTRNISLLSFHEALNSIPKNYTNNMEKNLSKYNKYKSNKSSSLISPRKSPSFLGKDINNIKKLINMINNRSQQKFKNYKSEKFINKKIINKENANNIKLNNIKHFQYLSSYLRKKNNILNKIEKTEFNDILENNKNNENVESILKDRISLGNNNKNTFNSENEKYTINKIIIKKENINLKNKINKSGINICRVSGPESQIEDIKPIKKYIQIPNIKKVQKENILLLNQCNNYNYNNKNKHSSNSCSFCNTNSNLITNANNYKTNNNSISSNYNNKTTYIYIKNNNNLKKYKNNKKINNSISTKKIEDKNKNYSSNGIRIKRKKYILNINNNIEKKYEKIIKMKSKNKNKYNSNINLYDKESNQDISYYSIVSSNSQINIHSNKNGHNNNYNKINDSRNNLQKKCTTLYKKKTKELYINNQKKENIYKIKSNIEKNQEKNIFIDSLRNSYKGKLNPKYKKINNNKKYCNLLSDNKENKNNINIKGKIKKNIEKIERNMTSENKMKNKEFINNQIYYLDRLLTLNDKKIQNKI